MQPADVMLLPPSKGVPVIAGRLNVTDPSAPVTGCTVTVPDVALPITSGARVPDAPAKILVAPIDATYPEELTSHPTPFASACQGYAALPDAVVRRSSAPVPVFEAVSVIVIRFVAAPVAAPKVHVVVYSDIASD
jgi:hypothetical protein